MPALNQLDRISSLRDEYPYRPYAGGASPYVRRDYQPAVEDFVSAARNASQPVYETRAGYRNFDRFDDRPQQRSDSGPRTRGQKQQPQQQQQQQQKRMVLRSSNNKDLKDTTPKKVLKRPAKAPNQQSLSDQLKQMGSDEPVIGLKYVTEFPNSSAGTFSYKCDLCDVSGNASKMAEHITSKVHRRNYITDNKLEEVADKDLEKRAAAIETVHGRGEWSVAKEEPGFQRIDKSQFFKKVKKGNDVDMADVSEAKNSSGLTKGDVVVDELVIGDDDDDEPDPESNPKFFVLKQIDKLLDEDFVISNESEAMVVDSIIRKMDRSLAQFVELANTETGIDEIQLLDKDDSVTMIDQPAAKADAGAEAAAVPTEKAKEVETDVLVDLPDSEPAAAATTTAPASAE
jgi:hypothetical protein